MMLLKNVYYKLVTKINTIDSDKRNLEKEIGDVDKKISDTSRYNEAQDFNRLTKINVDARMEEASKKACE